MTDTNTTGDTGNLVVTATSYLTLNYRIGLPEGGDLINTFEDKPATLMMGSGQFSPGLEQALLGMCVGERKTFTLEPESAYGIKNPELIRRISLKTLRENSSPDEDYLPGDMIEFNAPNVQVMNPQYQDLQGVQMLQMGLTLVPGTAGNDEISLKIR